MQAIFSTAFGPAFILFEKVDLEQLGIMESVVGKPVVIFDEPRFSTNAYQKLKHLITGDRVNLRAMYTSNRVVKNVSKFIILANRASYQTIKDMEHAERRFPLFQADNIQINQENYFDELYKYINNCP